MNNATIRRTRQSPLRLKFIVDASSCNSTVEVVDCIKKVRDQIRRNAVHGK